MKIGEASVKVLASRDDANRRGRTRWTRTVRSTRSVCTNGCGFARLGRFLSPKGARGFVVGGVPGEGATFSLAAPASRCRRRGGVGGRGDGLHLRGLHFRGLGFREIGLIRSRSGLVEWARGGFLGRRSGLVVMLTAMGRRVRGGPRREPHGEGLRGRLGRRERGRVQGTRGEARGVHRRQRFRSRRRGGHPHQSLLQLHLRRGSEPTLGETTTCCARQNQRAGSGPVRRRRGPRILSPSDARGSRRSARACKVAACADARGGARRGRGARARILAVSSSSAATSSDLVVRADFVQGAEHDCVFTETRHSEVRARATGARPSRRIGAGFARDDGVF